VALIAGASRTSHEDLMTGFMLLVVATTATACAGKPTEWNGTIEARTITLASPRGGRVHKIAAKRGDHVKAGQVLIELDGDEPDMQQAVAGARPEQATEVRDRPSSELLVPQARALRESPRRHLAVAAQLVDLHRTTTDSKAELDRELQIASPSVGRVEAIVGVGDIVAPHGPVATLRQDEALYVRVRARKAETSHIRVGDRVPFRLDAFPDETFTGKIERVGVVTSDPTVIVDIAIISNKDELHDGMAAVVLVAR
jgi:membrane fusion protein (multidrug efflux system)